MNIFAINGSPRKTKNTATLLQHALNGAVAGAKDAGYAASDIHSTLIHLYEYTYTGCKRLGSKTYGHCAIPNDVHLLL